MDLDLTVEIWSKDNPLVKEYIKLKRSRSYRKRSFRIAVEGPNLVFAALDAAYTPEILYFTRDFYHSVWLKLKVFHHKNVKELILDEKLFKYLADTETPQAVAAIFKYSYSNNDKSKVPLENPVLILDRISDPGNMGAIIRTAAAAGVDKIFYTAGSTDPFSPKALRATAGAIFQLPPEQISKPLELLSSLRQEGFQVVVSSAGDGHDYRNVDFSQKTALVIGNEAEGVSEKMRLAADIEITIPLQRKVESLNAAVASGILLFEMVRNLNSR